MQKCPECGFHAVHEERVIDPQTGEDVGSRTVCGNCGNVLRDNVQT